MTSPGQPDEIKSKLITETSRISWRELQTYYARGQVVRVSGELDLLEVAEQLTADNKARFEAWMAADQVGDVSPDLARAWYDREAELWAVVIAPWVLVQDKHDQVLH
ncbi:DUF2288 domain-containing protein [uncultured Marinobacter sp.]|uniref:DUF2288 domain-containing protein n=1 Tax=uncultured Marinobacter sp. TaxID=187379 RepID=UPI0030D70A4E|tara:strand:- start:40 stop:360 length:321 start_codon:yes stop_codon:yes gene_type:complete